MSLDAMNDEEDDHRNDHSLLGQPLGTRSATPGRPWSTYQVALRMWVSVCVYVCAFGLCLWMCNEYIIPHGTCVK